MLWEEVGERIAELRQNHNLTQAEFAEILGVSRHSVGKIENGKKSPGDLIPVICNKLGVTSDYIYFGKRDPLEDLQIFNEYDPLEIQILLDCLKRLTAVIDTANGNDLLMKEIMRKWRTSSTK